MTEKRGGKYKMKKQRNYSVDVLKIIATIIILCHHYQQITGAFFEGKLNFYDGKFSFGFIVELFFVISGYCIIHYVELIKKGLGFSEFYLKRAKRLLPLVACAAVMSEMLCVFYDVKGWEWYITIKPNLFRMLVNAIGMQGGWVYLGPVVNSPTWYVAVLLLCYVIFYIITYLSNKWKISVKYGYFFMILIGCGVNAYGIELPFLNNASSRGFYSFFFGVLLGMYLKDHVLKKKEIWIALATCGIIIYCGICRYDYIKYNIQYTATFVFYPSLIIIANSKIFRKIFSSPFWAFAAKVSYNTFIWHIPLLMVWEPLLAHFGNFNQDKNNIGYMLFYVVSAIIVGILSRIVLERPMEKRLGING